VESLARLAGFPLDEFSHRYWTNRDAYEGGLSAREYWRRVLGRGTLATRGLDQVLSDLIRADAESWTVFREDMWNFTSTFKVAGGRTAMLSNGVPEIMEKVRATRSLDQYFDVVVVSYEVGCVKPDPAIYRICLERLGVPASSALFTDDRVVNLEAASRLGFQTLHFTGDESVDALRTRIGPLGEPDKVDDSQG
jgi:putative hydrolase of the HAD superfamily